MNHFVPTSGVPAIAFIGDQERLALCDKSVPVRAERRALLGLHSARRAAAGGLT